MEPENAAALGDAVVSMRNAPSRRRAMAVAGRAYARQRWDKTAILDGAERWLEELVDGPVPTPSEVSSTV